MTLAPSYRLGDTGLDLLFRKARTYSKFQDRPVSEETLKQLYELAKWGPTMANGQPLRLKFLVSQAAKDKLGPCMMEGNRAKTLAAPAVAIVGHDLKFWENYPRLFPAYDFAAMFRASPPEAAEREALRSGSLQAGYVIMAARSLGLDCGPMAGFNGAAVDAAFWAGTNVKTNVIINLGYGDPETLYPRGPRLDFNEAAEIL